MPIFEYKCINGHMTERLILHTPDEQDESTKCNHCGAVATKVDVSRTSFRLMPGGSGGFYSPSKT